MLQSCIHTGSTPLYRRAVVTSLKSLKFSQSTKTLQTPVTRLQMHRRPVVTSAMAASNDVVSEEYKPNFKKQNQEFLGTVCLVAHHHEYMEAASLGAVFHLRQALSDRHCLLLQEERMDPPPDFGYDSYKGSGKLKNKVQSNCKYSWSPCMLLSRLTMRFDNKCKITHNDAAAGCSGQSNNFIPVGHAAVRMHQYSL